MTLRIKKNIENHLMHVWSQTVCFSFLHIERSQKQDEESFKFVLGSWNWIKEIRSWKEKFWVTAQNEDEARTLIEKYYNQKLCESKNIKSKLNKDFQLTKKKALGIQLSIHSKLVSSKTKNCFNKIKVG